MTYVICFLSWELVCWQKTVVPFIYWLLSTVPLLKLMWYSAVVGPTTDASCSALAWIYAVDNWVNIFKAVWHCFMARCDVLPREITSETCAVSYVLSGFGWVFDRVYQHSPIRQAGRDQPGWLRELCVLFSWGSSGRAP